MMSLQGRKQDDQLPERCQKNGLADMQRDLAVQTENLTKRYGDLLAVDHLSFHVIEGEIFGFLGPNGSGKTTTIRMLTGLAQPTEGRATILGYPVPGEASQARRYVGVVPDISNLYDELSALDNLLFMAKLYGVPKSEQRSRADQLLKDFGLYLRRMIVSAPFLGA